MAHEQDGVYADVAERHPDAAVIVPPRRTAVLSDKAATAPTQRDRHLQCIAETSRRAWQKASGYNKRAKVEASIGRWKQVIGDGLRSRIDECRMTKSTWRLMSSTVCWSWDARTMSASSDPKGIGPIALTPLIPAPRWLASVSKAGLDIGADDWGRSQAV
jgi:hypothetical protein